VTTPRSLDLAACLAAGAGLLLAVWLDWIWLCIALVILLTFRAAPLRDEARQSDAAFPSTSTWLGGLFLVACCFWLKPALSDDYHRFLWEGFVQNQGYSPYLHAPASLYEDLDHPSEGLVNNDGLTAIYPPLAQWLFRVANWLGASVYAWKFLLLLTVIPLLFGKDRADRTALLLSPIVLVESVWNAHLDLAGLFPGFVLVHSLSQGRGLRAGLALAAMTGLKIMPAGLAPFCLLHLKGRERLTFLTAFVMPLVLLYAPYIDMLPQLFDSFLVFSRQWHFNNPFYRLLTALVSEGAARAALTAGLGLAYAAILFSRLSILQRCAAFWIALTVFSPTLYPWYLIWLAPFLPGERRRWLHWAYAAACLSYLVLIPYRATGEWRESWLWMTPEWIGLLYCFHRMLARSRDPEPA